MRTFAILVGGLAVASLAAPAAASPAASNGNGGIRLIVQRWSPVTPASQSVDVVLDRPQLLGDAMNQGWSKARDPVCKSLKDYIGKSNLLKDGVTLYNIECKMAQIGVFSVSSLGGNRAAFSFKLPANHFKATATTPSIFGSYGDPCFMINYDVTASSAINLDTLNVDDFVAKVDNVSRPDSCNASGDIGKAVADIIRFFGGPDFLAKAQDALTQSKSVSTAPINSALQPIMATINRYRNQYADVRNWVRHGDIFFIFGPRYVPQPLNAVMSGTIRIVNKATSYVPANCSVFNVSGTVQTGPALLLDPENFSALGPAPSATVGAIESSGAPVNAGDHFECAYAERQLPSGVPIAFAARDNDPRLTHHATGIETRVGVRPDGWSGTAVVPGSLAGKNFIATAGLADNGMTVVRPYTVLNPGDPPDRASAQAKSHIRPGDTVTLNPQPLPPKVADPHIVFGNAAFGRGDFAGAATAYQRAVDANASNAVALHNLALAHARMGLSDKARLEMARAAELAKAQGDAATMAATQRGIITVGGHQ